MKEIVDQLFIIKGLCESSIRYDNAKKVER